MNLIIVSIIVLGIIAQIWFNVCYKPCVPKEVYNFSSGINNIWILIDQPITLFPGETGWIKNPNSYDCNCKIDRGHGHPTWAINNENVGFKKEYSLIVKDQFSVTVHKCSNTDIYACSVYVECYRIQSPDESIEI